MHNVSVGDIFMDSNEVFRVIEVLENEKFPEDPLIEVEVCMSGPGREGIISISLSGDRVQVYTSATTMEDPLCCPSTEAMLSLRASGGRIIQSDLQEEFRI